MQLNQDCPTSLKRLYNKNVSPKKDENFLLLEKDETILKNYIIIFNIRERLWIFSDFLFGKKTQVTFFRNNTFF